MFVPDLSPGIPQAVCNKPIDSGRGTGRLSVHQLLQLLILR